MKSIFATSRAAFLCAALSIGAVATPAAEAATPFGGRLTATLGVAGVLPDESAKISAIGGTVDISDEYVPALTLDYALSKKVSVELLCCVAPHKVKAVSTAVGTVDLGEVTLFPPTLTLKYHFLENARVKPYVGAGVNVTAFFNEKLPAGPVRSIDYDTTVGPALQVGANIPLSERLVLNLDVKKIWIEPNVKLNTALGPVEADVKINPIVTFVGLGYKF